MCGIDKTMTPIGGIPMILRTVRALAASDRIDEVLVVTREDLIAPITALCMGESKFAGAICGGTTRTESVKNGLLAANGELVAIHDGARPFVSTQIIDETIETAQRFGAAAPAIPVRDTIKVSFDGKISTTPDRASLFAVQTPQVFYREEILDALQKAAHLPLTDDCSAMEAVGKTVVLTQGSDENIKITTPIDLAFGEVILKRRQEG